MLDKAQNRKTFSNCQATYQKELSLLFEKSGNFFSQNERTDRFYLPPLPMFFFVRFLRTSQSPNHPPQPPPPPTTTNALFE